MEFPGLTADPLGSHFPLLVAAVALPAGARLVRDARVRVRVRTRPRPRPARSVTPVVARVTSMLGFAMAISSGPAAAGTRKPVSPHRPVADAAPPWSEAGGFPPPRPLARTGGGTSVDGTAHPALHGRHGDAPMEPPAPLFRRGQVERDRKAEIEAAMARHPSGKASRDRVPGRIQIDRYVVKEDDSLWTIAERVLGTGDVRAVARYWPRIHRANRAAIGADPSLLFPGQVLDLPERD